MIAFFVVVSFIWLGSHALIAWRLAAPHLATRGALGLAIAIGIGLAVVSMALIAATRNAAGDSPAVTLRRLTYLYMGAFSVLFAVMLLREVVVQVTLVAMRAAGEVSPDRRAWLHSVASAAALALTGGMTLAAWRGGTRLAPVVRVEIPFENLPEALDGFRIVQLTDIHVGAPLTARELDAIVERTNALEPDLLALTGDLVDGSVTYLADDTAAIERLRAKHGCYFVTGNHEYYSGVDQWRDEVRRRGFTVLDNEHIVLDIDGAKLVVAGVTDFDAERIMPSDASDPAKALRDAPEGAFKLMLAHQPKSVPAAKAAGADLQLSGHTHGGQYAPYTWLVDFFHPVGAGLTRLDDFRVYVSRGTGVWGPPMRLGAPNEITEIVLRRA